MSGATTVYLLMDADDAGRNWVRNAINALSGRVGELVVLHPATNGMGDDIADHLDSGHELDDMEAIPLTAFWAVAEEWPDLPMPLDSPNLPAFPVHLLGSLSPMVRAVSAPPISAPRSTRCCAGSARSTPC
ncbi:hypothetical protein ACFQ9Q_40745 [Streptomyces virginiae]|uniref:hypothetical protein n=1 Tax=Streptomyces virginiae TaxID=1961 RepID=UPI0036A3A044